MTKEERILTQLKAEPALSFCDEFLREHPNASLYLVGGAVRDALLDRPMKDVDFDFVIRGLAPERMEEWFRARGEINLVGEHFGVYKFMPYGFSSADIAFIDIALPRTEAVATGSLGGYRDFDVQSDPTLPIEQDLARRDFTMNAIAFEVRMKELVDPFDGQADIQAKLVRAVGNPHERFREDLTRILRALRFAAELGCTIEEKTFEALKAEAQNLNQQRTVDAKVVFVVPREVIGEELVKMLARAPAQAAAQLHRSGVLDILIPQLDQKALTPLSDARPGEPLVCVALLLRSLAEEELGHTIHFAGLDRLDRHSSLRIDPRDVHALVRALNRHLGVQDVTGMPASEFERLFMNERAEALMRCLELTKQDAVAQAARARRKEIEERWLVDRDEPIAPLLSGQDVLAKGVELGPMVRLWLDRVRDEQLDGTLMRREDALGWLEQQLKQKSSGGVSG